MKYLFFLGLLVSPALMLTWLPTEATAPAVPRPQTSAAPQEQATARAGVAVLELFTSQGCSSCPPADQLLAEYAREDEENIIVLSFHVDYWNRLGWEDPYSSPRYSARQTDYTDQLSARTYTPQLIVNGSAEMIGSRRGEVAAAVSRALDTPVQVNVDLEVLPATPGEVAVKLGLTGSWPGKELTGLLLQDYAATEVPRGENRGRHLEHHNVVRQLIKIDPADLSEGRGSLNFLLPEGMTGEDVSVVILVADPESGKIVGASLL